MSKKVTKTPKEAAFSPDHVKAMKALASAVPTKKLSKQDMETLRGGECWSFEPPHHGGGGPMQACFLKE